jgi:hypothetical protein
MVLILPFLTWICYKNSFVKENLYQGWIPILCGMLISTFAGMILRAGMELYEKMAIFQPLMNGLGGNLVAIYASRLSTIMQDTAKIGEFIFWAPKKLADRFIHPFYGDESELIKSFNFNFKFFFLILNMKKRSRVNDISHSHFISLTNSSHFFFCSLCI